MRVDLVSYKTMVRDMLIVITKISIIDRGVKNKVDSGVRGYVRVPGQKHYNITIEISRLSTLPGNELLACIYFKNSYSEMGSFRHF